MKAMREALEQIAKLMDRILVRTELDDEIHRIALEAQNMADGVLSLSPRNCDVGTAEEQTRRLRANCKKYKPTCKGCEFLTNIRYENCWLKWSQVPYKEGGGE